MFKFRTSIISLLAFFITVVPAFSESPYCEIINYSVHYEFKNDKLLETDSIVIQINNRMGEKYTNISIPYSKNQRISDLNAWIEDNAGQVVRKLKSSDIVDKSAILDFSLYEDDFVKSFSLKHNTYPYRIIINYKTTCKQFISIQWSPVKYHLVPTQNAKLTLITPQNYPLHKYGKNIVEPQIDSIEGSVRYIWSATYTKPIKDEIYSVSLDQILPSVTILPVNFVYGVDGNTKDWSSFGNWQFRLMKDLDNLPDAEKSKVSQLIKGVTDKREIVKMLYYYMQDHTRYVNVSIDIGGLKPYPASYVAQNKYGDCKALSNYMKALLNSAGINAYYTLINRDNQPGEINRLVPGPQYFNHAILTVPLGKDTVWLENTSNISPFGYISPDIQNREALIIKEVNSRLIKMPVLSKLDVVNSRKMDVTFDGVENVNTLIKASFKGDYYDYYNQLKSDLNKDEQDKLIRKIIRMGNFDLITWDLNKPHRDTGRIDMTLKLTLYKVLKSLGQDSYFSTFRIDMPSFSSSKERTTPVEVPFPVYNIDSVTYHLPIGFEIKLVPEKVKILSFYGSYEFSVESKGSDIEVVKKIELFPGIYSLSQYVDLYKFMSLVNEKENIKIVIKKKS